MEREARTEYEIRQRYRRRYTYFVRMKIQGFLEQTVPKPPASQAQLSTYRGFSALFVSTEKYPQSCKLPCREGRINSKDNRSTDHSRVLQQSNSMAAMEIDRPSTSKSTYTLPWVCCFSNK